MVFVVVSGMENSSVFSGQCALYTIYFGLDSLLVFIFILEEKNCKNGSPVRSNCKRMKKKIKMELHMRGVIDRRQQQIRFSLFMKSIK